MRVVLLMLMLVAVCRAEAPPEQRGGFACGLNAAYIFLNRAGHHVAYDELVREFLEQQAPDSLLAIKTVLARHGCTTVGIQADAAYFLDNHGPAIVYLQLSGYTRRSENHFALHFAPSGQYRGWALLWAQQPMTRCPTRKGEDYVVLEQECWVATPSELHGKWSINGDRLCLAPAPQAVTDGKECVRAALVLSSVVFFGADGKMIRKGSDLRKGQDAARTRGG